MTAARAVAPTAPVLEIEDLSIVYGEGPSAVRAVQGASFTIASGGRLGLVGESGSGKTTTAMALMGMIRPPGRIVSGVARLDGTDLLTLGPEALAAARLRKVSYIPQGAMNALNPVLTVRRAVAEGMIDHGERADPAALEARIQRLLKVVGLGTSVADRYPHELSGGMKQRVCIAIAVSLGPRLLIADEPTSALDVVTQRQVMGTLRQVQEELGSSLILIGHDMGLMAQFVDELVVMHAGRIVEAGATARMFRSPRHDYTRTLIEAVGRSGEGPEPGPADTPAPIVTTLLDAAAQVPLLELAGVAKAYGGPTPALAPIDLAIDGRVPRIIAVVGQSGSGKTTLGQIVLGLLEPSQGQVRFDGRPVEALTGAEQRRFRARVQAVLQDPYGAFNPFYHVDRALLSPLRAFGLVQSSAEAHARIDGACRDVGLEPHAVLGRYPHELSGGQRQRLVVARALLLKPSLLVADEPVSMVDASLRATILGHLRLLRDRLGVTLLYITHDLATAQKISDYVLVLFHGRIVEAGRPEEVIGAPGHPYTRLLIDSIPWPDPARPWASERRIDDDVRELDRLEQSTDPTIVRSQIEGFRLGPTR